MWCLKVSAYLVDESPERGEDVPEGGFGLADFKEGQVDVEDLLHQGVVTFAVLQLGLGRTQRGARLLLSFLTCVRACVRRHADLETLREKIEDIQDTEADLSGHVPLQQGLMVDLGLRRPRPWNTHTHGGGGRLSRGQIYDTSRAFAHVWCPVRAAHLY